MKITAEHRLRNDLAELRRLGGWLEEFSTQAGFPPAFRSALDHALVEWVTNVISYAYADAGEHWITIRLEGEAGRARMEVADDGREFNPLERPPVDTSLPLEARPIGGLGIHMIRQMMDAVEYRRENGRNILTMTKRAG